MRHGSRFALILLILLCVPLACAPGRAQKGFHSQLRPDEDGTIAVIVEEDDDDVLEDNDQGGEKTAAPEAKPEPEPQPEPEPVTELGPIDQLTEREKLLIKTLHQDKPENISFLVVNAKTGAVVKSFGASKPRILASVTKIFTGLAALQSVNNVNIDKVSSMLRTSNNAVASYYVRLAAKAIDGTKSPAGHFKGVASCPDERDLAKEKPAARAVHGWFKKEMPSNDWSRTDLQDGAGCDYDNVMSAKQVVSMLAFSDSLGKKFDGKSFEDLLSIAGVTGTWRGRNANSKGMIFAKTGTLLVVSNLSGFVHVKRGGELHRYYFSMFVRKSGGFDPKSSKSRALLEAFLKQWIKELSKGEKPLVVA